MQTGGNAANPGCPGGPEAVRHEAEQGGVDSYRWLFLKVPMTSDLAVELGEKSYPIHFPDDVAAAIRDLLATFAHAGRTSVLLTDAGVAQAQSARIEQAFGAIPRLVVPAGEGSKSLATLGRVLDFLAAERIGRQGVLWVVGGGVTGDLGGFAAASYLRGISYVQVPTTLLAMVDSSVGGKTGINLPAGKNLAGAFHHPRAVFIGREFLRTLPPREFAAGAAEIVKYGLLGDGALFARLEQAALTADSADLAAIIRGCCAIKARVVAADEFELAPAGGRALLNLGHTFGHAIEQAAGYGEYLHGEAVAIGLVAAARLSHRLGLVPESVIGRVERVLAAHALPVRLAAPLPLATLMAAVARDKKVRAGLPRFVVLTRIGEAATRDGVSAELAEECFRAVGAT